jgi:hypothetical protein
VRARLRTWSLAVGLTLMVVGCGPGLIILTATMLATGALAQPRPSSLAMSCGQARALVAYRGAVVLGTGRYTYDRYVNGQGFCLGGQYTRAAWVPTADTPQCFVGYTCVDDPDWFFLMTRAALCRGYRSEVSVSERSGAWHTTVPYRALRSIGSWDPGRVQGLTQHTLAPCCYVTVISCGTGVKDNSALTGNQLSCPIAGHLQGQRTALSQYARAHAQIDDSGTY